jgi:hypothetical protein
MTPRGADRRPADRHLQKDFPSMLPRAPFLTIGLLALSLAIVAGAPPAVAQSAGAQATRDRVPAVLAEMIDLCLIGMRDRPALEAAAAERQWVAAAPETIQDGGTVTVLSKTENGHRLMLNLGSVDFADFSLLSCGHIGALLPAGGQGSVSPGMLATYLEGFASIAVGRGGTEAFALSTVDADGTHIGLQIGQRRGLSFTFVGFRPATAR